MAVQQVGFFGMLRNIYATVSVASSAVGKFAQAADNLGTWADEQTGSFVDEARMERRIKAIDFQKRYAEQLKLANVTEAEVKAIAG